jgi:hypothetical protein
MQEYIHGALHNLLFAQSIQIAFVRRNLAHLRYPNSRTLPFTSNGLHHTLFA